MVREGLEENYPQLQNLIKRDAGSYEDEFKQQYEHFQSTWNLLCMGQAPGQHLEAMLMFIAHCAPSYKHITAQFGEQLLMVLEDVDKMSQFEGSLRRCIVQAVLLLKRDAMVDQFRALPVLFKLLRIKDKGLRELVTNSIVQELKKATPQLSKHVLNFLEEVVLSVDGKEDEACASAAVQSLDILITVYAKQQHNSDARAINIIANAGLNEKHVKLSLLALNFLIGQAEKEGKGEESDASDSDSDQDDGKVDHQTVRQAYVKMRIAGKTKGRQAKIDRLVKKSNQAKRRRTNNTTFPAIQMLYDPQRYAERLLSNLKRSTAPFEGKLTMMNVLSLIIGQHQLVLPDYYPVLLRYLQPHQRQVTKVLCFCAQASHSALPGDVLAVTVKAIANNFVADHCAAPVIAAGLNTIRECCSRCPDAMTEELLRDLAQYKGYKDKSVMMAARSLIGLYRKVSPELLHRKDRGRPDRPVRDQVVDASDDSAIESAEEGEDDGEEDFSEVDSDSESTETETESEDLMEKAQHQMLSVEEMQQFNEQNQQHQSTVIGPESILSLQKKKRLTKQERLEHVQKGRGEKPKFGAASKTAVHRTSGKSQSNKVKRRNKLVSMLKRSKTGLYGGKKGAVKKRRHA